MQNDYLEEYPAILTPYEVMEILVVGENIVYELLNSDKLHGVALDVIGELQSLLFQVFST